MAGNKPAIMEHLTPEEKAYLFSALDDLRKLVELGGLNPPPPIIVNNGATTKEIASAIGKSESTVRNARNHAGVPPRPRGHHTDRYNAGEIYQIGMARYETAKCRRGEEMDRWDALLYKFGQPPLGSKPQAVKKSDPNNDGKAQ